MKKIGFILSNGLVIAMIMLFYAFSTLFFLPQSFRGQGASIIAFGYGLMLLIVLGIITLINIILCFSENNLDNYMIAKFLKPYKIIWFRNRTKKV